MFGLLGVSDCKKSCNAGGLASLLGLGGWLPRGTVVKNPPADAGDAQDTGLIPELGRSPGVGTGNPLQYSCLENSMDGGTWWVTVYGLTKI